MPIFGPTQTLVISADSPDPDAIALAAEVIRRGGLVAFATETVYGLGADATSPRAVARIFEAKGRPGTNPLIVHLDSIESARPVAATWPDLAEALGTRFWPGPLTLVLPRARGLADAVTAGGPNVAIRVPRPMVARDLIARCGLPIAAPSANRSLGISPTLARHVAKDLAGRIELILDSGPTAVGLESTVLDLTTARPSILRPGTIRPDDLAPILGFVPSVVDRGTREGPASSPGQSPVHYAPRTPTFLATLDELEEYRRPGLAGLLLIGRPAGRAGPAFAHRIELLTPDFAEPAFYDALHRLDEQGLEAILIVAPPDEPTWAALRDRLARAARPLGA